MKIGGSSVVGLLGVAFVVLKLCGVINWSWWLVTLPFYGPLVLMSAILAVYVMVVLVAAKRAARNRWW